MRGMQAQVVIVGGGPVGMVLARELAGYGMRTVVFEAETQVSRQPKATTLHARTVQTLVRRGYLSGIATKGRTGDFSGSAVTNRPFHFAGMPGLAISAPAAEPEPILKCAQDDLERHFEQRARVAGARIMRGYRVTEVRQGPDGVAVVAEGPDGRVTCTGDYLVGTDGARSLVRKAAGFTSRTYPATVSAMAGDVRLDCAEDLPPGWHRTARGWIVTKHLGAGAVRLRTLNCEGAHPDRHAPLTLEELRAEVSWLAGRDIAMSEPRWLSRFSDFSRLADCYRKGRVFLAGDAAHLHFPIGGQGLSTGLLDAVNLGWKLAFTVRGTAGEGLLDTYDEERRPAAQRVIDNTRAQLALMRPAPEIDPLRDLFGELLAGGRESGVLASMISAQDTVLPARGADASPWGGRFLHNVDLMTDQGRTDVISLLSEGRPLLLVFGDRGHDYAEQARGWAGLVQVVYAEPVPQLSCPALLVRPDGYIAWAAGSDGPTAALTGYFGPGAAAEARGVLAGTVS